MASTADVRGNQGRLTRKVILIATGVGLVLVYVNAVTWFVGALIVKGEPFQFLYLAVSTVLATNLVVVGALISLRRPGNVIGPLLLLSGWAAIISFVGNNYVGTDHAIGGNRLPAVAFVAWFSGWTFVPTVVTMAIVVPLLFPDGHLPGPRWRLALYLVVVLASLNVFQTAFQPGPLESANAELQNPFGLPPPFDTWPAIAGAIGTISAPLGFGAGVAGVAVRFRRSSGMERAQLKWFVLVTSIATICFIPAVFNTGLLSDLGWLVGLSAVSCLPIAIGIAIVRYRLYEIDRVLSRTIAYALTTGALVAVFGVVVLASQAVLQGVTQGQSIPVAVSTLAAASLFQPVRRRVQTTVDRQFNRARVDAERTVTAFAERLRDEVDLDHLESELSGAVTASLQPTRLGVWLRPVERERANVRP